MSSLRTHTEPVLVLLLLIQTQLVVVHSLLASGTFMNHTAVLVVPCVPDHASALLRLKRSFVTTNESITAFRSWRAGTDCCGWEGVRCRGGKGRVTSLDLSHRRLRSRALNPSLFNLTSLEHLNLAYNDFSGSQLPSTGFERLLKLTHLNLSTSKFDGQVPTGIRQLTSLVSLDLSTGFKIVEMLNHGFYFEIASHNDSCRLVEPNFQTLIAKLGNLREIKLGYVDLSGNGVHWCDALGKSTPKIRLLSLPYCRLIGPICPSLSSLHSLVTIDLERNYLSGPIPDFLTNFSSLRVLQLQRNKLEGWVSPAIFLHKKLVTINLYHNLGLYGNLPNFSTSNSFENLVVGRTNFFGTIPSSISNLKSLKRLGLSAYGFSGELPFSIGKLKSLNSIEISGTGLVGSIPLWVANLTSLKTLQFSDCGLSGPIPSFIGDLTKLETLFLCNCSFSGKIPSHISNLTQLQILSLYENNLFGKVEITSLRKLPQLYAFDISHNNLVVVNGEDNSSFASFPKIMILGLAGCRIYEFPSFLRYQYNIDSLDLSDNQIHGAIPKWAWENWDELSSLNLANNRFTSIGYGPLLPSSIEVFDLSNNMFQGPIPIPRDTASALIYTRNKFSSIPSNFTSHLSDVTLLMVSENNFSGNIPSSFCGPTSIQLLDLSYNSFNGSLPHCLMENANGMVSLNLKDNELHGKFPDSFTEGCSFEALDLSGNLIEGQLPRSLFACKNLQILDVGKNLILDSFPCWMSSLHRLEVLVLKSNKLFGHVAQSIGEENTSSCAFPSVRIVDLSSNNFSGPLPQDWWFKKLKSMILRDSNSSLIMDYGVPQTGTSYTYTTAITYKGHDTTFSEILRTLVFIDVSNNAFSGEIPEAIGELVLLHGLNMSHNFLNGTIPSQVRRLNQLEALDISSNELSGVIPHEIASLDFLTMLNLSYNKLEGKIPESPHFLTFSNNSFLGNDGLCGSPLSKECSNATTTNVAQHTWEENYVDIMLFLLTGLGFGVGFAVVIVVTWVLPCRKRS
ncbi:hypothetical protein ACQ4PT_045949 [Festuca glaucescens]